MPDVSRSIFELPVISAAFVRCGRDEAALAAEANGFVSCWLCRTASPFMRLFMIQHDCGHGACFKRRATNDWVGRIIGVFTLNSGEFLASGHALAPTTPGKFDHRGSGDIITLTADEYLTQITLSAPAVIGPHRNPGSRVCSG